MIRDLSTKAPIALECNLCKIDLSWAFQTITDHVAAQPALHYLNRCKAAQFHAQNWQEGLRDLTYGVKASWEQGCTTVRDTQHPLEHLQGQNAQIADISSI